MSSRVQMLTKNGIARPPKWLPANIHYECQMGSVAYGVSNDNSDVDIYGFCIPPKDMVFPHLAGEIPGFGKQIQRFEQYQEHHLKLNKSEYDLSIYSIVKFFQLCMDNNPNMVDSLFVPNRCVLFASPIGQMIRDKRSIFLHKGSYHKFRGYAYQQLHKIKTKSNSKNPKRMESIEKYGYDVKFAYHVVRLALEGEQILVEQDLDLEKNREVLKSIRRGEWSKEKVFSWFDEKEKHLEELYNSSTLRNKPDQEEIKTLLLDCLEHHYGSLDKAVKIKAKPEKIIEELKKIVEKYE